MKKRTIFILIILMLIILLALVCTKFIVENIRKNKVVDGIHTQQDLDIMDEQIDSYLSDKITPSGMSKLYGNYKGENDLNDIYRSLYNFVNYLPKLSKKIEFNSADSINSYYEKNKEDIKSSLGISNYEEFAEFIEYLNEIGYQKKKFINCEIDSSTFKNESNYFSFDIKFNFEDFNNEFKLKLNFANYKSKTPRVYYSIIQK